MTIDGRAVNGGQCHGAGAAGDEGLTFLPSLALLLSKSLSEAVDMRYIWTTGH